MSPKKFSLASYEDVLPPFEKDYCSAEDEKCEEVIEKIIEQIASYELHKFKGPLSELPSNDLLVFRGLWWSSG